MYDEVADFAERGVVGSAFGQDVAVVGAEGVVQPENSVPQLMGCYPGYPLSAYVVQKDKPVLSIDGHVALTRVSGRVGENL